MKKNDTSINRIIILLVLIFICDLGDILTKGLSNFNLNRFNFQNVSIENWVTLLSSIIAVWGTLYVSNEIQKKEHEKLSKEASKNLKIEEKRIKEKKEYDKQQREIRKKEEFIKERKEYYVRNYMLPLMESEAQNGSNHQIKLFRDVSIIRDLKKMESEETGKIKGSELSIYFNELFRIRIPLVQEYYVFIQLYASDEYKEIKINSDKNSNYSQNDEEVLKLMYELKDIQDLKRDYILLSRKINFTKYFNDELEYTIEECKEIMEIKRVKNPLIAARKFKKNYNLWLENLEELV